MASTTFNVAPPPMRLDYGLLRRAFVAVAMAALVVAPLTPDPIVFAVGGFVPWLVMRIVGTPTLLAAIVFFLLWQWMQIFARPLLGLIDGEAMTRSVFGPWVENAYWYMMASVIALTLAFRVVLGSVRPPGPGEATAHLQWRPIDLFLLYLACLAISYTARYAGDTFRALDQPAEAVYRLKIAGLLVLFGGILSLGRGYIYLAIAVGFELLAGFSGILGDFRGVFIFLFVAALAVRIRWTGVTTAITMAAAAILVLLALFWTSVKTDYRGFATRSDDSQNIKVSLDARFSYLGNRFVSIGDMNWDATSYALLSRLAYVDIFGSVIGVQLVASRTSRPCRTPKSTFVWRAATSPRRCASAPPSAWAIWRRTMPTWGFPACCLASS